jgi:hypothetical protein
MSSWKAEAGQRVTACSRLDPAESRPARHERRGAARAAAAMVPSWHVRFSRYPMCGGHGDWRRVRAEVTAGDSEVVRVMEDECKGDSARR